MRRGIARGGLALLALLVLLGGCPNANAQQDAVLARITARRRSVSVGRGAASIPVDRADFPLLNQDLVATGPASMARVVSGNAVRATMYENSRLRVRAEGASGRWDMLLGSALFWVTGRGRTEIRAGGTIAAAQGTGFLVSLGADDAVTVSVAEGTVEFTSGGESVAIRANQQSRAAAGAKPSRPVAFDAGGLIQFEADAQNLALAVEIPLTVVPRRDLPELVRRRRAATGANPLSVQAFEELGDALLDSGEFAAAIDAYQRAAALGPPAPRWPAGATLAALRLGALDTARDQAEIAGSRFQDDPWAAIARGAVLLASGKPAEAEARLSKVPDARALVPLRILLGVALLRQGKAAAAEPALRAALAIEPENYAALAQLSAALLMQGKVGESLRAARRAAEAAPGSPLANEALGAALLFSGDSAEAVSALRSAVERAPGAGAIHAQLARALAAGGGLAAAEREAALAVSLDPADPAARNTLGVIFAVQRDRERAVREFSAALRLAPDYAAARTGLSAAEVQRGRFAIALREQKAALDLDAGSAQAHNNLGVIETARGHLSEAVAEFKAALQLQPGYPLAHANLAIAYLEQNRFADSLAEASRAARLGEDSALLQVTLARIYLKQQRQDRALEALRRAATLDPELPLQHFYLAQVYGAQGREADGVRALLRGLSLDPATAAEQRQFARTETLNAYGSDGRDHLLKTDGRLDQGKLTYFVSAEEARDWSRGAGIRDRFLEAILGFQPDDDHNLALLSAHLDERGARPGKVLGGGRVEDPNFRRDQTTGLDQFLYRYAVSRTSSLTLTAGRRAAGVFGDNPPNPHSPDTLFVREFDSTAKSWFGELQLEGATGPKTTARGGIAWQGDEGRFFGRFPDDQLPGHTLTARSSDSSSVATGWVELRSLATPRIEVLAGLQGQGGARGSAIRPKLSLLARPRSGGIVSLLMNPTFQEGTASLLPVEPWAQPFESGSLTHLSGGVTSNYEATWQKPAGPGSLFTATAFYRDLRGALVTTVDPVSAPIVARSPVLRGSMWGGQAALDRQVSDPLSLRAYARYSRGHDQTAGAEIPYIPLWVAGLRADLVLPSGIRASLDTRYVGRRSGIDPLGGTASTLGGFVTVDLTVNWQRGQHWNYFIQLSDLLDRAPAFYSGYPSSGRAVLGGVEFRF